MFRHGHAADCGTCLQIEVNLARKDRVPVDVLRAAIEGRMEALPPELAEVHRFAEAVARATGAEDALRERLRGRYGEEGLIELAHANGKAYFFPRQ